MVKNRRVSDDGCCSASFLKYLVFIYHFVFYLAGIAILSVGLWTLLFKSHYVVLLASKTYSISTYMLILAGVLCIVIGIVGCVGLTKENRSCILTFALCLLVIFFVEIVAGILAYVYSEKLDADVRDNFKNVLQQSYGLDEDVTRAADLLHTKHGCCGAVDFRDWRLSAWYNKTNFEKPPASPTISAHNGSQTLNVTTATTENIGPVIGRHSTRKLLKAPHVCCKTINSQDCGERDHPSNIYYDGCLTVLKDEIREHVIILGATAIGISAVQIFGIIISCLLYWKLGRQEEEEEENFDDRRPFGQTTSSKKKKRNYT